MSARCRCTLEPVLVETDEVMASAVHIWHEPAHALCGSTDLVHEECGPDYPWSVDRACPRCYRPICAECVRLAS